MRFLALTVSVLLTISGCAPRSEINRGSSDGLQAPTPSSSRSTPQKSTSETRHNPSSILPYVFLLKAFNSDGEDIGLGSGFLANKKIFTNAHVVADAAWIEVYSSQGSHITTAPYANFIDTDHDIAILPYPSNKDSGLRAAKHLPELGEDVWAYGAPLGLQNTVSKGNISSIRRDDDGIPLLLQVTAPISKGSSGGPILNANGEVVGIAVAVMSEGQNLNFAVPATLIPKDTLDLSSRVAFPDKIDLEKSDDQELKGHQYFALYSIAAGKPLEYGTMQTGSFTTIEPVGEFKFAIFSFSGQAGQRVRFAARGEEEALGLMLYDDRWLEKTDPWGVEDHGSGVGNASVISETLSHDGTYFVAVIGSQSSRDNYTLFSGILPEQVVLDDRWRHVSTSSQNDEHYLDTHSIIRPTLSYEGDVHAWILVVFEEEQTSEQGPYRRSMYQIAFKCDQRQLKALSQRIEQKHGWTSKPTYGSFDGVTPGTVAEEWLDAVCSH